MNDILPKPFTKEGLLDMLEVCVLLSSVQLAPESTPQKHLMHLKVIQEMAKVPRGPGIPPLNDSAFNEALVVGTSASTSSANGTPLPAPMSDDDARINPLAGLGLSDEQYAQILQTIVKGDTFNGHDDGSAGPGGLTKRALEDPDHSPREEKRSRFQVMG